MTKILIVCDDFYRFAEPAASPDFTFIRLVEILTDAGMSVTKAHRDNDSSADIEGYRFDTSDPVGRLDGFDEIWMFGAHGRVGSPPGNSGTNNLDPSEIQAIEDFMAAGGGVFATGDHESIGADMCGRVPRLRLMRAWYGDDDNASPMPANFPRNFAQVRDHRAQTLQRNSAGNYSQADTVYFANQSDAVPQTISPTTFPAHPILRDGSRELVVFPDHMHEGRPLGPDDLQGIHDYDTALPLNDGSGRSVVDFPDLNGHRELPEVIATGDITQLREANATSMQPTRGLPDPGTVNTFCVYDGLTVGVGRIVSAATFHHYIDINLDGTSGLSATELANVGPDAQDGVGFFGTGGASYDDIKQIFINIAHYLARPRLNMNLILERSTIGQDEAIADPVLSGAILVSIDGVRPSQFPSGGITSLGSPTQLASWAPQLTVSGGAGITIEPIEVQSDDPSLSDRIQRVTFKYRIVVDPNTAFNFPQETREIQINAQSVFATETLTDFAVLQLVKSANPFMLDLANSNETHWLSSDLRVFPLVTGRTMFGHTLPLNASRTQALSFLRDLTSTMTVAEFESLATQQAASALSPLPTTTNSNRLVYNFAIARVRLNGNVAVANDLRVFFRIFTSQTTAALTFNRNGSGPSGGYRQTPGTSPISLPSPTGGSNEWLSLPMFASERVLPPENQTDPDNVGSIGPAGGSEISEFFGALIDNNLSGAYLPLTPNGGGADQSVPDLLVGEHQCLVAQIEHPGTPIPNGARPSTSDKLSQRNIALSEVANPGQAASRVAMHTFEIEATPIVPAQGFMPDELVLEWSQKVPDGTRLEFNIPSWNAQKVVDLADQYYSRHEIEWIDDHTISIPAGGIRYVPIPRSAGRQVGVVSICFPLGIKKGQRFDLAIRQITNRSRDLRIPQPETKKIDLDEAREILSKRFEKEEFRKELPRGHFAIDERLTLVTDIHSLDEVGDFAILIREPDPKEIEEIRAKAGGWRELVGAFQLGVPVSTREEMLDYHLRLLSLMVWRLEKLSRRSRWMPTMRRYVELLSHKVGALGGRPELVPATPDGHFDLDLACGKCPDRKCSDEKEPDDKDSRDKYPREKDKNPKDDG